MATEIEIGDRVEFDDAQWGPQRGRVADFIYRSKGTPTVAMVQIDYQAPEMIWCAPVSALKRIKESA